jgi:CRP-like cAMP-binding protein
VVQKNVGVREDLASEFNKELSKVHLRAVRLAQMSVREKVANAVQLVSQAYGIHNSTKPFTVSLSRVDIGDLIGCTKEQVSKNFSDLKDEKVIAANGKQLQILNHKKLKEIAGV